MGNVDLERQWDSRLRKLGISIQSLERASCGEGQDLDGLIEVRFKLDADNGTSVLCVLKMQEGADRLVAFVAASNLTECVLAVGKKLAADGIRWRPDKPWEPR